MILLNFSHPLTPEQLAQIEALTRQAVAETRGRLAQFDSAEPFSPQVRALLDEVGLSPEQWQTEPLLLNLPGFAAGAAMLLAEFHGRSGHFPAILRIRPVKDALLTRYEVAEIINLQALREDARTLR